MIPRILLILALSWGPRVGQGRGNVRQYAPADLARLRDEVRDMFQHAYQGYLDHAYPYDELRPLSCDGVDTWGSYSLTLIDALDTLAVMGNHTEFRRVYQILATEAAQTGTAKFDADLNVSVFETNIRIVGGLLSAHLMAKRAGAPIEPGWPCAGPLLRLAEDVAGRLLPAFDTPTGLPYGTVNLRHGVPAGETPVTCTAGLSTFIVEFGTLSGLSGNPVFEEAALRALRALFYHRSPLGLVGNHIDVITGKWTATDAGIGAGVDSYYEYLIKGAQLLQRPELMAMFKVGQAAIEQYMRHDDWHFWVSMKQGAVTMPVFQSLEAFWPGALSLIGENMQGMRSMHNYHQIWKQYGFLPEFYNVPQSTASSKREGYPLRPEHIESIMYLYRATRDPFLLQAGEDILRSIQFSARTDCGYATVKDVRDHTLEDRMESFFLAETTKYLYLLFDTENFIHNAGDEADIHVMPDGRKCILEAGGYVFNTEAHPVDPAALKCCSAQQDQVNIQSLMESYILDPLKVHEFQGELVPSRIQRIAQAREIENETRRKSKEEHLKRIEAQRAREREAIKRKRELEAIRKKKFLPAEEDEEHETGQGQASIKAVDPTTKASDSQDASNDESIEEEGLRGRGTVEVINLTSAHPQDEDIAQEYLEKKREILDVSFELPEESASESEEPSSDSDENQPEFEADTGPKIISSSASLQKSMHDVLIKRQSKDEAFEVITSPKKKAESLVDTLSEVISKFLPTQAQKFDLTEFTQRLMKKNEFRLSENWYQDHFVMSCPAQSFLERFSLQGEFFENY